MNDLKKKAEEMTLAGWKSQILCAGINLNILDSIKDTEKSSYELARELSLNESATYRLLRALNAIDILKENEGKFFSLTKLGSYFLKDHHESMQAVLKLFFSKEYISVSSNITNLIRTGKQDIFSELFGEHVFEYSKKHTDFSSVFNEP